MRWTVTLAFSFLAALCVLAFDSACMTGKTIVLVTDCANKPVAGVNIDIRICCTPAPGSYTEFSAESAENGEASFPAECAADLRRQDQLRGVFDHCVRDRVVQQAG